MFNTFGSEKFKEQQRKINSSSIDPNGSNKQNSCPLTILLKSFNMRLVCSEGIDYNVTVTILFALFKSNFRLIYGHVKFVFLPQSRWDNVFLCTMYMISSMNSLMQLVTGISLA